MVTYLASEEWHNLLSIVREAEEIDAIHTAGGNGRKSREIISRKSIVSMTYPVVANKGRSLNYQFMCAEACMILSGSDEVVDIAPYCKTIANYSDDGITFFGAYGPRIHEQMDYALDRLIADPYTRQAVISIWRPNPPASKDIPCTLSLQFIIRKNALHVIANMRSSDVWLGWPYDVFNFSMVGASVLLALRSHPKFATLALGHLMLHAGSQHLYENHYNQADNVITTNQWTEYPPLDIEEFVSPSDLYNHLRCMADRQEDNTNHSFLKHIMV